MLIIRPAQMQALRKIGWRNFVSEFAICARREIPRCAAMSREQLMQTIGAAVKLSQRHGFRGRPHMLRFMMVALRAGLELDGSPARPWASAILNDEQLNRDARLDRLEAAVRDPGNV